MDINRRRPFQSEDDEPFFFFFFFVLYYLLDVSTHAVGTLVDRSHRWWVDDGKENDSFYFQYSFFFFTAFFFSRVGPHLITICYHHVPTSKNHWDTVSFMSRRLGVHPPPVADVHSAKNWMERFIVTAHQTAWHLLLIHQRWKLTQGISWYKVVGIMLGSLFLQRLPLHSNWFEKESIQVLFRSEWSQKVDANQNASPSIGIELL